MSTSVVLVPGAPALVPELSGAAAAESAGAVAETVEMVRQGAHSATGVEVRGPDRAERTVGDVRSSLVRWGVDVPVGRQSAPAAGAEAEVPDAALLGWWFLDRAGVWVPRSFAAIGASGASSRPEDGSLIVVVADGPASLTPAAPVPADERGVALNAHLADWLEAGGPLPDPGLTEADEVGWWSRPVWLALAALVGDRPALQSISWAPFGVGYHSAWWDLETASSSDGART